MLPLMSLFTGEKAFPKAAVNKYKKNIFYKFMKLQFDNELKVFLLYPCFKVCSNYHVYFQGD